MINATARLMTSQLMTRSGELLLHNSEDTAIFYDFFHKRSRHRLQTQQICNGL
jgi:hypothetical protein